MQKFLITLILSIFVCKSYGQVYHNDLQLGVSAGPVFAKSVFGVQGSAELKFLKFFSISYRALTCDGGLAEGFFLSSATSYSDQAMLIGFHLPIAPSKHQLFFKVGPGYFVKSTYVTLLFSSESTTTKGKISVFETGYSFEKKAMDLQLVVSFGSTSATYDTPVSFGVRIGLDPLYWILPQKDE